MFVVFIVKKRIGIGRDDVFGFVFFYNKRRIVVLRWGRLKKKLNKVKYSISKIVV